MRFPGWQSLRRNWLVIILGVLLSIGLIIASLGLVRAKYVSTSQLVLLPPISQPNASYNGVVNPYMGLTGLQSMAAVVASAMSDDDTATTLQRAGVTSYSVEYNSLSAGPILVVQATEPTSAQATAAMAVLDQQVPLTVARLQNQAAISPKSFITAKVIARPSLPAKSGKTQLRVAALSLVVGIVLTLLAVSLVDGWRLRRRERPARDEPYVSDGAGPAFVETPTVTAKSADGALSPRA